MKKLYQHPELECLCVGDAMDILTASGAYGGSSDDAYVEDKIWNFSSFGL